MVGFSFMEPLLAAVLCSGIELCQGNFPVCVVVFRVLVAGNLQECVFAELLFECCEQIFVGRGCGLEDVREVFPDELHVDDAPGLEVSNCVVSVVVLSDAFQELLELALLLSQSLLDAGDFFLEVVCFEYAVVGLFFDCCLFFEVVED